MKRTHDSFPPEQTVADLAHLSWCGLVALRLAQKEGGAQSLLTIHAFLLRWLAGAQKQRHFPRSVAPDLESLLALGRQKGAAAGLEQRLEYLWKSCSNPVKQQSDLFRLTYAIESLKSQGWINAVVSDEEWVPLQLQAEYAGTPALLVRKSELTEHYSEQGALLSPVSFLVAGDVSVVTTAMDAQALCYTLQAQGLILLQPGQRTH
ncbi:TPA: DUF2913 family protein [Klebsiella aerogenes]